MGFLMLTDAQRRDLQAVMTGEYSCVVGEDGGGEWSLEQLAEEASPVEVDAWVYLDGTEFAGIAQKVAADTEAGTVTWSGASWAGVLAAQVLRADPGQANLRVRGEANAVLLELVGRMGLSGEFGVSAEDSGLYVDWEFPRFADGWTGIRSMLRACGGRPAASWSASERRVVLSAVPAGPSDASGTTLPMRVVRDYRPWNHIVAAGEGEGTERVEAEWFADKEGNVSKSQTFFGAARRTYFYDYGSSSDIEEDSRKKLEELQAADEVEIYVGGEEELSPGSMCRCDAPIAGIAPVCEIDRKEISLTLGEEPEYGYEARRSAV